VLPATGINYSSWALVNIIFNWWIKRKYFAWWCMFLLSLISSGGIHADICEQNKTTSLLRLWILVSRCRLSLSSSISRILVPCSLIGGVSTFFR